MRFGILGEPIKASEETHDLTLSLSLRAVVPGEDLTMPETKM